MRSSKTPYNGAVEVFLVIAHDAEWSGCEVGALAGLVELQASTDTVLTGIDKLSTVVCSLYDARYVWHCFQHSVSRS